MDKIYKLQYNTQIQTLENGRTQKHRRVSTTLPASAIRDMGLDEENNVINMYYDEVNKRIIITKI